MTRKQVRRLSATRDDAQRLARLEREGIIRRAANKRVDEILRVPPIAPQLDADVLAVVIEERRSGR